jgi:hypothetical protein
MTPAVRPAPAAAPDAGAADGGQTAGRAGEIAHGALRGTVAAMAMSGMRSFTVRAGLVEEPPPRAILRQKSKGLFRVTPRRFRRAAQELCHWTYGAAGGAAFAVLPRNLRMRSWAGPAYGLGIWLGFEAGIAPLLGLWQAKEPRPIDRAALAADHLLYGFVLSELRRRPRE